MAFNAPADSAPRWYQHRDDAPDNFCAKLNRHLERYSIGACVWRSSPAGPLEFHWSGRNDHRDRLAASEALWKLIVQLTFDDPSARIHLVAHSHGGNVLLHAVEQYLSHLEAQAEGFLEDYPGWPADHPATPAALEEASDFLVRNPDRQLSGVPSAIQAIVFDKARRLLLQVRTDSTFEGKLGDLFVKRHVLVREWLSSSETNRLGRLVCMGTPFLTKHWTLHGSAVRQGLELLRRLFSVVVLGVTPVYIFALLYVALQEYGRQVVITLTATHVAVALAIPGMGFLIAYLVIRDTSKRGNWSVRAALEWCGIFCLMSLLAFLMVVMLDTFVQALRIAGLQRVNPLGWPPWVAATTATVSALLLAASIGSRWFHDTNLYFDEARFGGARTLKRRVPILTISASYLDEALIALSMEPLLRAHLLPRVRELFRPRLHWALWRSGVRVGSPVAVLRTVARGLWLVLRNTGIVLTRRVGTPFAALAEHYVAGALRKTIMAAATGLPADEISDADPGAEPT